MLSEDVQINAAVELTFEVSKDGFRWERLRGQQSAREIGRTCGELRQLLSAYTGVLEASGGSQERPPRWVRVVMQERETRRVLAVVPRRWSVDAQRYEPTGGEWMITETPEGYQAWVIDLVRARVAVRV